MTLLIISNFQQEEGKMIQPLGMVQNRKIRVLQIPFKIGIDRKSVVILGLLKKEGVSKYT